MAIEYERINWDTTKYVNPTNMNQMDAGIKAACDGVDANDKKIGNMATLPQPNDDLCSNITAINNKISNQEGTLTIDASIFKNSTSDASGIYKTGNMVTLIINGTAVSTIASYGNLGVTIPSGFRPPRVMFPAGSNNNNLSLFRVAPSGGILLARPATADAGINLVTTYITNE